jgi:hypothetical protein
MMFMAWLTPALCAKQLGHSAETVLRTHAKWIDGRQHTLEMSRLDAALTADWCPTYPKTRP